MHLQAAAGLQAEGGGNDGADDVDGAVVRESVWHKRDGCMCVCVYECMRVCVCVWGG